MNSIRSSQLLKFAFAADAAVSGAVAVLQLLFADDLSRLLALPRPLLVETGIFLVGYALLLAFLARCATLPRPLVLFLILGNAGWAIGCAGVLALTAPSGLGVAFVIVQALTVLLFAGLQMAGMKGSAEAGVRAQAA